jgi:alcohol dehydrogenase class IV
MVGLFTYEALPQRVLFGPGRIAEVAAEVRRLGGRRALVLSTKEQREEAQSVADLLGDLAGGIFAGAVMHTPTNVTETALAAFHDSACDCTVAIGGGSTIGLGKAISLRTDAPQIVLPTTYAGSEVTTMLGETEHGKKTTQRTLKVVPEVVIYDVNLTLTLPPKASATSGMNAIAHAVEALYAKDGNPIVSLMAEEGIRALARSLPAITEQAQDVAARTDAQYGAWLCGSTMGLVSMGLHHKICHALGGAFDLPHAEMHAIVLPHVAAFNAVAAPEALDRVARAIGASEAGPGLFELERRLGIPRALCEIGMPEDGVTRALEMITASLYWNPRPVDAASLRPLLQRALTGEPPASG